MRDSRLPVCEASRARQGAGVIDIDATSAARSLLESLHDFSAVHWDHEPSTGETAPLRCCRHLAGSASSDWSCRQDAGSPPGFLESRRYLLAVPTRCRTSANGQVTRAKCIFRMAQCIAVMGAKAGARYRAQVPIRPHTAPYLVPARRVGTSDDFRHRTKFPVYARAQRCCVTAPQSSFNSPTYLRIV